MIPVPAVVAKNIKNVAFISDPALIESNLKNAFEASSAIFYTEQGKSDSVLRN